jgi:hypothetical protein
MARRIAAVVLAVCAACGGGGSPTFATGSASVTGTIGGQSMTPRDAVSVVVQNGSNSAGEIVITNFDTTCAKFNAHQEPKNSQAISIAIGNRSSLTGIVAPSATGTYAVYAQADSFNHVGLQAIALFVSTDASCNANPGQPFPAVTGGTVVLTRIDASGYSGTFDLTFATNTGSSHVTGSFTSAQCAPLATVSTTTCI